MKKIFCSLSLSVCCVLLFAGNISASDLDDGISKYTDDSVGKWDDLGKSDKNIKFIVLNAKSKASSGKKDKTKDGQNAAATGDANMNSVVMGAGSNIKGDIYIIDQSKGSKTNIAQ